MKVDGVAKRAARLKRALLSLAFGIGATSVPMVAHADETTQYRLLGAITVRTAPSGQAAYYYFSPASGAWGSGGICSGGQSVRVDASRPGAKELLAAALFAKQLGKPVAFMGTCEDASQLIGTWIFVSS